MPVLTVNTNVKADKVPADFKSKAIQLIAKALGKPASYVAIHIIPNQDLCFGDDNEPAALCDLVSIGALSTENNKKVSNKIAEYLETTLGVRSEKMYITFRDFDKANIGYQGTTFHDLI